MVQTMVCLFNRDHAQKDKALFDLSGLRMVDTMVFFRQFSGPFTKRPGRIRNLGTLLSFCLVDSTVFVQQPLELELIKSSNKNSVLTAATASCTNMKQISEEEDTPSRPL
jgi:hypothetical protein